jgi:ferredoxin
MERKVTVRVDHGLCIGNAMCRAVAPKAFGADAEGQAVVADPEAESLENLIEAVDNCPTGAVVVLDAETEEPLDGIST